MKHILFGVTVLVWGTGGFLIVVGLGSQPEVSMPIVQAGVLLLIGGVLSGVVASFIDMWGPQKPSRRQRRRAEREAITAADLALQSWNPDKARADSITGEWISARAINADQIRARAIVTKIPVDQVAIAPDDM